MNMQYKAFKYKGRVFLLLERDMNDMIPGMRVARNGIAIITINKNLSPAKKRLFTHRLITGRGLDFLNMKPLKERWKSCLE